MLKALKGVNLLFMIISLLPILKPTTYSYCLTNINCGSKSTKNYLPHPYSTDCRDYSYHRSNEIGPNILGEKDYLTRSGCMLASIRRKYKANNCDYGYWTEYAIEDMSQINWTKTFTDTECENKVNFKEIERNCRIECQHTDYFVTAIKIKRNKVKSELYQLDENHLIEN